MKNTETVEKKEEKEKVPDDVAVPIPPDGGYGWVVLVAAFFVSFIIDGCMYSFGIVLPSIRDYFGVTQDTANIISSLNTGFIFMSGPAIAGFANQFGIRVVIMSGAILAASMFVISTFSTSIYMMYITFGVIGGISMGCTYIPSVIIIAMYFDKLRGIATGITMAGSGVGTFVFAPLAETLLKYFDWRMTNIILGAVVLQCCVLGALLRPVQPTKKKSPKKETEMKEIGAVQAMTASAASLKQANIEEDDFQRPMYRKDVFFTGSVQSLAEYKKAKTNEQFTRSMTSIPKETDEGKQSCTQRYHFVKVIMDIVKEMTNFKLLGQSSQFLFVTLANFFVFTGYFIPFIFVPLRCKELNIENSSWVVGVIGIVNIPARILFGLIADRKIMSAWNLNTISFIICLVAHLAYPFLETFYLQLAYGVIFAIGISGLNALTSVYLVDIPEIGLEKLTNATGIMSLFRGVGCLIGPFVGGIISVKINIISAFLFSAFCFAIGVLFVMLATIIALIKRLRSRAGKNKNRAEGGKLENVEDESNKKFLEQTNK